MPISTRQGKYLLGSTLFVLLALVCCAFYFYTHWKHFKLIHLPIPDCDLRQSACRSSLSTGEQVQLFIKATHMPVLTSLHLEVKLDNLLAEKVFVYFKGAEMNMGEFRYNLTPHPQRPHTYTTQTILPTCIQDNMVWHAVVYIEAPNKRYSAPFILINQRPTNHF